MARDAPSDSSGRRDLLARSWFELVAIALGAGAGLFLAWHAAPTLLLIFAGLLCAVLLDAGTDALGRILPLARPWRLAIVCLVLVLVIGGGLAWGGYSLAQQADELFATVTRQLRTLRGEVESLSLEIAPDGKPAAEAQREAQNFGRFLLPDPAGLFGHAAGALGAIGNVLLVLFLGFFLALNPAAYRDGALLLLPRDKRPRVGAVMDEVGSLLRSWLVGQLVTMVAITLSLWAGFVLIGMPAAFLLALQAGLVNFIPYLGPVIAAVPVALAAIPQGSTMLAWALGIFVLVQLIEGYVLTPLIQRRASDLQPALTLGSQMVFGALFGAVGIALATPLTAAARIFVLRLFVEDGLGEPSDGGR
jgi:predicted PurR-regulated permease PerM